jgi:type IV secretory pathway VirB4 component
LDFVWDKAKEDRTVEKAIFIDEIWQLVGAGSNAMAAEFCLEIFKIIRGYGGAAIAATQDLNDFLALDGGKYGKGVINNAMNNAKTLDLAPLKAGTYMVRVSGKNVNFAKKIVLR